MPEDSRERLTGAAPAPSSVAVSADPAPTAPTTAASPLACLLVNALTLCRIPLALAVAYFDGEGRFQVCFAIMVAIGLSDLLDGIAARRLGCSTRVGAVLDATVDFLVVLFLTLWFFVTGRYPVFLPVLVLLAFGLFALSGLRKKGLVKTRFGRYTGAVLYAALGLDLAARGFAPGLAAIADLTTASASSLILVVSILENVVGR
jgi:CDP-diacylglycerol---glycerol-3-phosphate 3-phosphatidyltransferase